MSADEPVEVLDPAGCVVGVVPRAEMRARRLRHRCVFVVVLSTDGQRVLAHRRADWKDIWPSRWDLAFGGVCAVGEGWDAAARRELAEETGLIGVELTWRSQAAYADAHVDELARLYSTISDGPFTFADGEVAETEWAPRQGLAAWCASRAVCPDSLAVVLAEVERWTS
ncbi:MAG: NUDIX domain-containing protein [Acidimicrobiales bacterium]